MYVIMVFITICSSDGFNAGSSLSSSSHGEQKANLKNEYLFNQ